eukprot:Gb_09529 [translate_table: standard]
MDMTGGGTCLEINATTFTGTSSSSISPLHRAFPDFLALVHSSWTLLHSDPPSCQTFLYFLQQQLVRRKVPQNLLAIAVGIKQKENVDQIVRKFPSNNFTVMLFHYDGVTDKWSDLNWSDRAIHVSAINQTKW